MPRVILCCTRNGVTPPPFCIESADPWPVGISNRRTTWPALLPSRLTLLHATSPYFSIVLALEGIRMDSCGPGMLLTTPVKD